MDGFQLSQGYWDSLLFTTQSPGVPGAHLIDIERMKECDFTLEPPSGFEPGTPGLGNQQPNHYDNWGEVC